MAFSRFESALHGREFANRRKADDACLDRFLTPGDAGFSFA